MPEDFCMQQKVKKVISVHEESLHPVEVLVVIAITTALLLGVIVATNPLGRLLTSKGSIPSTSESAPFPTLSEARKAIHGGMSFATAMNEFPQIIGGYIAPYETPPAIGDPFYLEVTLRDRLAPITRVIAKIEGQISQEIPLTLIDGTEQDGTWGGVWRYTGDPQLKIISYDQKNNKTEVGIQ